MLCAPSEYTYLWHSLKWWQAELWTDLLTQVRICIVRVGLRLLAGNETNLSCSNRFSLPLRLLLLSASRAHIQPHRPIRSGAWPKTSVESPLYHQQPTATLPARDAEQNQHIWMWFSRQQYFLAHFAKQTEHRLRSESFVFQLPTKNIKFKIYRTVILPYFVWVWNLVSQIEGRT